MALNICKECGREVSDKARACPQCAALLKVDAPGVVTELQSKRMKTHDLAAALMMLSGLVMAFGQISIGAQPSVALVGIGLPLFLVGSVYWFVTRFRSWWHHG
jgi:hypothetical protein